MIELSFHRYQHGGVTQRTVNTSCFAPYRCILLLYLPEIFVFIILFFFFFSSRRRHTRSDRDWSSDVCSSDLARRVPLRRGGRPGRDRHRGTGDRRGRDPDGGELRCAARSGGLRAPRGPHGAGGCAGACAHAAVTRRMAAHGGHREARGPDVPARSHPRVRALGTAAATPGTPAGAAQARSIGARPHRGPSPALTILRARRLCVTPLASIFDGHIVPLVGARVDLMRAGNLLLLVEQHLLPLRQPSRRPPDGE